MALSTDDLTAAIQLGIEEFDLPPKEINSGLCGDFVDFVCRILNGPGKPPDGVKLWGTPPLEANIPDGLPYRPWGHSWIVYGGKHYDAEVPEGVDHASKLPIFRRYREHRLNGS